MFLRHFSKDQVELAMKVFDVADINNDDTLEFTEFAVICFDWSSAERDQLKSPVQEVVCDLSRDGKDVVSQFELQAYFGESVPPDELESFLRHVSNFGEATLSSAEILSHLKSDIKWVEPISSNSCGSEQESL